jgi:hypothetical protein
MSMGDDDKSREPRSPPADTSAGGAELDDRLTIRRMLLLTAGVAVGLVLFAPTLDQNDLKNAEQWRGVANGVIIGLAMPAPLFCITRAIRNRPLGAGGLFALAAGFGVWIMLPPAAIEWFARNHADNRNFTQVCLYYVLPLMGLWYLLAAIVGRHVGRRLFSSAIPWTERYGLLLALLWSPLGVWLAVDMYRDALR